MTTGMSDPRHLVIITGPVGAGKSTLTAALAELLRRRFSLKTAAIDLDVVYCMMRQRDGFDEPELWPLARRACACLASTLFGAGFHAVVLDGEYFTSEHFAPLRSASPRLPAPRSFTLSVSYAETLRRVSLDPSRGISKDPEFLRQLHGSFVQALPFLRRQATVLDAEQREPNDLARQIAAQLDSADSHGYP